MANKFIPFRHKEVKAEEQLQKSNDFYTWLNTRRSIRDFSNKPVDINVIKNIIKSASTAPSGAHKQPWSFCVVANPSIKREIRIAAEKEEKENYNGRMSERWLKDLQFLETNEKKPFLEKAPYLIIVFKRIYEIINGEKHNNYYVNESVGIAVGILIAAIHNAGLVTLTHTPSPMIFLTKTLKRPANERPFLLLPVGYPSKTAKIPVIARKTLKKVMFMYE